MAYVPHFHAAVPLHKRIVGSGPGRGRSVLAGCHRGVAGVMGICHGGSGVLFDYQQAHGAGQVHLGRDFHFVT